MGTLNGFGTGLRGWRHLADGTSIATSWVLFAYVPLVPLRRYRLRTLTDFANERFGSGAQITSSLLGHITWIDPIAVEARLPLSWREIGMTYLRSYVLVPLLCLWPFALVKLVKAIVRSVLDDPLASLPAPWELGFGALALVNLFAVLLVAARRMRGAPGSRKRAAA